MSLYNLLLGTHPAAAVVLAVMKLNEEIPRFRDAYYRLHEGEPYLVILTRTGGANRETYSDKNRQLEDRPDFAFSRDDDYDNTFAEWYFRVPPTQRDAAKAYVEGSGEPGTLGERWEEMLDDMKRRGRP